METCIVCGEPITYGEVCIYCTRLAVKLDRLTDNDEDQKSLESWCCYGKELDLEQHERLREWFYDI